MPGTIDVNDLPPELRKQLRVRKPAKRSMDMHTVRTYAIKVMAVLADLTPNERARILRHASKLNEV